MRATSLRSRGEALDGKAFPIDRFPPQPKHPRCRCGHVAVVDLPICGAGALAARAAAETPNCILSPDDVAAQAQEVKADVAAVNEALKTGQFETLTVKQLQTAAKKQGISIARTKADFIKLLDGIEPGVDHSGISGLALKSKVMYHKVGALRSKQELIGLLKAQYGAAAQQAVVEGIVPPAQGYGQFSVKQLQDMAKGKGVSLNMTKQDVIDLLDKVEPGVNHSALAPVRPRVPAPADRRPLGQRSRPPLPTGPCGRRPRVNGGAAGRETDEPIGLQPAVRHHPDSPGSHLAPGKEAPLALTPWQATACRRHGR